MDEKPAQRGTYLLRTACGCEKAMDAAWPPATRSVMVAIPLGKREWRVIAESTADLSNTPKFNQRQFDLYGIDWTTRMAEFREVLP